MRRVLWATIAIAVLAAVGFVVFVVGGASGQLNCDAWCEKRIGRITLDQYLACKSVCHDIETAHILCIFDRFDNTEADALINELSTPRALPQKERHDWGM